MSALSDLLAPESIRLDVAAQDWREAIRAAGALLDAADVTDPSYTQAMIANVEANGPYIVIAPGFAFAHARPDESVHRTGMSLVRLAEPVEFGHEKNDPVTLVLALAAVDADAHRLALAQLARLLADPAKRAELDGAGTPEEIREVLGAGTAETAASGPASASEHASEPAPQAPESAEAGAETAHEPAAATHQPAAKNFVYTVCGNGLGTSLFLKNTLEQVLERWKWSRYITVEATDTISARGKAKDADFILTSGEIARTLGDVGIPVEVIENFTSQAEIDAVLRRLYDV